MTPPKKGKRVYWAVVDGISGQFMLNEQTFPALYWSEEQGIREQKHWIQYTKLIPVHHSGDCPRKVGDKYERTTTRIIR